MSQNAKANGRRKLGVVTPTSVGLVPSPTPNGHGHLKVGNPGNIGGPGNLPAIVRELSLRAFKETGLPTLTEVASDKKADASDRISAAVNLGKFGFGSEAQGIAAAQLETPDGMKFTLVLGERDRSSD